MTAPEIRPATDEEIALKPCPFCGATLKALAFNPGNTYRWWLIGCPECGVSLEICKGTPYDVSEPSAEERRNAETEWNTRPLEEAYRATIAKQAEEIERSKWQPINTAPKGGGADMTTDPKWVEPPLVLLRFTNGRVSVARWDWYYAEGGNGVTDGIAWIEPVSGDLVSACYGPPTDWMPIPARAALAEKPAGR